LTKKGSEKVGKRDQSGKVRLQKSHLREKRQGTAQEEQGNKRITKGKNPRTPPRKGNHHALAWNGKKKKLKEKGRKKKWGKD